MEMFREAGVFATLTLVIAFVPLGMATAYVIQPTERRLALMRPVSLAGLFAAVTGGTYGFTQVLRGIGHTLDAGHQPSIGGYAGIAHGASLSLAVTTVGFACLTAAWLLVAVGMSRSRDSVQ
jgi:hypothetical protein